MGTLAQHENKCDIIHPNLLGPRGFGMWCLATRGKPAAWAAPCSETILATRTHLLTPTGVCVGADVTFAEAHADASKLWLCCLSMSLVPRWCSDLSDFISEWESLHGSWKQFKSLRNVHCRELWQLKMIAPSAPCCSSSARGKVWMHF